MEGEIVISPPSALVEAPSTEDVLERLATFLRINVSAGDASENTIRAYMQHIWQFAGWCREQGIDPGRATEEHLALYRHALSQADYRRSTIGVKLASLRRFFQAAVWHGLRADNPAEGLKAPREHTTRRDKILARYLSPEEIDLLLATPPRDTIAGIRDLAMIGLLYYHGLRVSEVAALALGDLKQGNRLHIIASKGDKSRVVLLVDKSLALLGAWVEARQTVANQRSGETLFLSLSKATYGAPLTTPGARWTIRRHLKEAGLYEAGMGPHALRHCHASHALAGGVDLYALSAEMGHASIETTGVYLHVVDAVEQNPAEFL